MEDIYKSFGFRSLENMPPNTKPSDGLTLTRNNICQPTPGLDHNTFDIELIRNMLGLGIPFDSDYHSNSGFSEYPFIDGIHYSEIRTPDPTTMMPPKHCKSCSAVHSPTELCHGNSCDICYSKCHKFVFCPYLDNIPRGADFDRARYEFRCICGCPFFDTAKWDCSDKYCVGRLGAKLCLKKCTICNSSADHSTFECPKDKDLAAYLKYKMQIDYER